MSTNSEASAEIRRTIKQILLGLGVIFTVIVVASMFAPSSRDRDVPTIAEISDSSSEAVTQITSETATVTEAKMPEQTSEATNFEHYRVLVYSGSPKPLRLSEDGMTFRTRLKAMYEEPVDYGGSLVVVGIGCGTECVSYTMLDKSSGRDISFPLGGESNLQLNLNYRKDSSLIVADWIEQDDVTVERTCFTQHWNLTIQGFVPLNEKSVKRCSSAE